MLEKDGIETTLISAGKYKTEGNPFEPLSEEAKTAYEMRINEYYTLFIAAVARGRGVNAATVQKGMGQGRMLGAEAAQAENMIDGVITFDALLENMIRSAKPSRSKLASARRDLALM